MPEGNQTGCQLCARSCECQVLNPSKTDPWPKGQRGGRDGGCSDICKQSLPRVGAANPLFQVLGSRGPGLPGVVRTYHRQALGRRQAENDASAAVHGGPMGRWYLLPFQSALTSLPGGLLLPRFSCRCPLQAFLRLALHLMIFVSLCFWSSWLLLTASSCDVSWLIAATQLL